MKKLSTKILGLCAGLALIIGAGVSIANNKQDALRAQAFEAGCYQLDGTITGGTATYDSASSITQHGITWSAEANTSVSPWRIGGRGISAVDRKIESTSPVSSSDITKVTFETYTLSALTIHSISLYVGTSQGASDVSSITKTSSTYQQLTLTFERPSGDDWSNKYFSIVVNCTNTSTGGDRYVEMTALTFYRETSAIENVAVEAGPLTGLYKKTAYIECSAREDNTKSTDVTWTLSEDTTYVADQIQVNGASIDQNGKVTFEDNITVYAFATSNRTPTVRRYVACVATGLVPYPEFIRVDKEARLYEGAQVVIGTYVTSNSSTSLLTMKNAAASYSSRRGFVVTRYDKTSTIAEVDTTQTQVFTLVKGMSTGWSFTYVDNNKTYYLTASGSGTSENLTVSTSKIQGYIDFNISIDNGVATIVGNNSFTYNQYIEYFSNSFGGRQYRSLDMAIYIAGNTLPADEALTSISNVIGSDSMVDRKQTITASYAPVIANEDINVSVSGTGSVTVQDVIMNYGVLKVSVLATASGPVTITLTGAYTTTAMANVSITIDAAAPTHFKVQSDSQLFNGQKIVLGYINSNTNTANVAKNGTAITNNGISADEAEYTDSGDSLYVDDLKNHEFTIWYMTIGSYTGWVLYGNDYFLSNQSTSFNKVNQLSDKCMFTISISNGAATLRLTSNTGRVANYDIGKRQFVTSNAVANSYSIYANALTETDAKVAEGYENMFLKMDAYPTSTTAKNICNNNNYYEDAKDFYNNVLTDGQKAALSADGLARLQAWAIANGDVLETNPGTIVAGSNASQFAIIRNNSAMIIVLVASITAISVLGIYFILRKKKKNY